MLSLGNELAMRIDADKQVIKVKGFTLTFEETKSLIKEHYPSLCKHYVVAHKTRWIVDWMSVFKHAEDTKILNVALWLRTNKL